MTKITLDKALIEQAIDVINSECGYGGSNSYEPRAIAEELRAALAEPAEEPVVWSCPDCGHGQKFDHRGCIQRKNWNARIRDSVDNLLKQAGFDEDSSARHQLAMMNFDKIRHEGGKAFGWWNATYNNFFPASQISSGMSVEESPAYQRGELVPLYTSPQPPADVPLLTDDEINDIYDEVAHREPYSGAVTRRNVARAIEQAVRQKAGLK